MSDSDVCIFNIRGNCQKEEEACDYKHEKPVKSSETDEGMETGAPPATTTNATEEVPVVAKKVKKFKKTTLIKKISTIFCSFLECTPCL